MVLGMEPKALEDRHRTLPTTRPGANDDPTLFQAANIHAIARCIRRQGAGTSLVGAISTIFLFADEVLGPK